MISDWNVLAQIGTSLQQAPQELASAGLISYDGARCLESPEIRVTYHGYANTSGPRGGIGGQMITSFPCVVLIYEMGYAYVNAGAGCYFCCLVTAEFLQMLEKGANPWTHKHHFVKKKEVTT